MWRKMILSVSISERGLPTAGERTASLKYVCGISRGLMFSFPFTLLRFVGCRVVWLRCSCVALFDRSVYICACVI